MYFEIFCDANSHFDSLMIHKTVYPSHIIAHGALVGNVFIHSNQHDPDTDCCQFMSSLLWLYGACAAIPNAPLSRLYCACAIVHDEGSVDLCGSALQSKQICFSIGSLALRKTHSISIAQGALRAQSSGGMIVTSAPLAVYVSDCATACVWTNSGRDTALL